MLLSLRTFKGKGVIFIPWQRKAPWFQEIQDRAKDHLYIRQPLLPLHSTERLSSAYDKCARWTAVLFRRSALAGAQVKLRLSRC